MYSLEPEICGYGFFGVLAAGFAVAALLAFPAGERATDAPLMGMKPIPSQLLNITLVWKKNREMQSVKAALNRFSRGGFDWGSATNATFDCGSRTAELATRKTGLPRCGKLF